MISNIIVEMKNPNLIDTKPQFIDNPILLLQRGGILTKSAKATQVTTYVKQLACAKQLSARKIGKKLACIKNTEGRDRGECESEGGR